MKIYVNEQYEIIGLDKEVVGYKQIFETEQTRSDLFGSLCDACIYGYKYEPQYELLFNEDGSNARDKKTGEFLYKLDEEGNKIFNGYICYPFVDYKTLMLIQKQYEDSQKQVQKLSAQIAYLQMINDVTAEV
ncbi:hypothetical protein DS742_19150 [Lacrimispora amygdalina]|uniref:Uncharacterized protein n=1 Tax=Lacrimispora amygdalina TaxID=253257 RepID=A0A3E2N8H2_9FIRM|nr:hypothetical protein [Clostridium indicum]RFZ77309.1 hypothetical protein DS742_19150 [Clostridium indicum]